ncbi:hypothetical protein M231_05622 [Tremella mesenterica]|uniref:Uncharacterized protein n=1 Tax=Tremella mesenterica TaxID=5217 RepID=A0A4Q1BHL7_TREME|nr:hypothetical protein M231_05622 [Tremella mesenterica]
MSPSLWKKYHSQLEHGNVQQQQHPLLALTFGQLSYQDEHVSFSPYVVINKLTPPSPLHSSPSKTTENRNRNLSLSTFIPPLRFPTCPLNVNLPGVDAFGSIEIKNLSNPVRPLTPPSPKKILGPSLSSPKLPPSPRATSAMAVTTTRSMDLMTNGSRRGSITMTPTPVLGSLELLVKEPFVDGMGEGETDMQNWEEKMIHSKEKVGFGQENERRQGRDEQEHELVIDDTLLYGLIEDMLVHVRESGIESKGTMVIGDQIHPHAPDAGGEVIHPTGGDKIKPRDQVMDMDMDMERGQEDYPITSTPLTRPLRVRKAEEPGKTRGNKHKVQWEPHQAVSPPPPSKFSDELKAAVRAAKQALRPTGESLTS